MVHLKSVSLRPCSIGRPSFTDVHRDLTAAAASGYFTLPGEPDALALQLLRATEPKRNVGRGFAA